MTDRNFDFPRVYQQKVPIEGVLVLEDGRAAFQHMYRRPFLEAGSQMETCQSATRMWIDVEYFLNGLCLNFLKIRKLAASDFIFVGAVCQRLTDTPLRVMIVVIRSGTLAIAQYQAATSYSPPIRLEFNHSAHRLSILGTGP